MKKHKLVTMLSAAMLTVGVIGMTGSTVMAEGTEVETGSCGENLTYTLDDEGVLTISGEGRLNGSQFSEKNIVKAVIENGVEIGDWAFSNCSNLTEVTLPDSVISIGWFAFSGCTSLTEVILPNNLTSVKDSTFSGCTSLTEVTLPNSLTSVKDSAFSGCTGLTEITLPNSLTSIGRYAFSGCTGLTEVTLPDSVAYIDKGAFSGCSLTEITLPDSVKAVDSAFEDCSSLREATIAADSLAYTFSGCSNLEKVTLLNSVTDIAYRVFYNCTSLTDITIPASVKSIGAEAFAGCTGLKNIIFEGDAPRFNKGSFFGYGESFEGVTATAYYPAENNTWTDEVKLNYGGNITWIGLETIKIQEDMTDTAYVQGSSNSATIKCSGSLKDFESVEVDGKLVERNESNYTLKEGSTILTFTQTYLDSLSVGEHKIKLNYTNNRAVETSLTIQLSKEEESSSKEPDTSKEDESSKELDTSKEDESSKEPDTSNENGITNEGENSKNPSSAANNTGNENKEDTTTTDASSSKTNIGNSTTDSSVKTGDSAAPILWLLIAVFAAGGCFTVITKKHSA